MIVFTDLHLHTTFSDGTYSPEELAAEAKRFGLVAVALTDHDTVEGCVRMRAACDASSIEFIPATELTCEVGRVELHMLGYFLDVANPNNKTRAGAAAPCSVIHVHRMTGLHLCGANWIPRSGRTV